MDLAVLIELIIIISPRSLKVISSLRIGQMAISNEFHNGEGFFHIFIVLIPVVMKSDKIAVIFIDLFPVTDLYF